MFTKLLTFILILAVLVLIVSLACFLFVFFVPRIKKQNPDAIDLPKGKVYEPYHALMEKWVLEGRNMPYEDFYIKAFDGITLHARYFEYQKGAPCEIMFHGYRGTAERDLSGGLQRCFAIGRNVLLVDQRTTCKSGGHVITFGIREHRDCLSWVDFATKHFGNDVPLILTGISMGASTVLMAAGKPLPPNVKGVLADCGFTSAKEIIKKCSKDLHLPADLLYLFVKLGARLFGGFNLEEYSAIEAVKNCTLPVIFVHNDGDNFVPCYMSRALYEAANQPKCFVEISGDGHGLSYLLDNKKYFDNVTKFFTENGVPTELLTKII